MSKIDDIITGILQREGAAYTNDLKDSGGPTKYGITLGTLAKYRPRGSTVSDHDVAALTEQEARLIYTQLFVVEPGYSPVLKVSAAIAAELVDTGVNCGPARATMMLQQALNALNRNGRDYADIPEDGACGAGTVSALLAFLNRRGPEGEAVLLKALNALQGSYYIDLARRRPKDEEYVYGWLKQRVTI